MSDTAAGRTDAALDHHTLRVAVVLCVYTEQRWPQIVRAVQSLLAQRLPASQIAVVVDHNEALLSRARAAFPQTTVVANAGPRGLSGARNTGIATTTGDIVAFLDDDAEAAPDWLARLLAHYADPHVLAVGGRAVPAWERPRPRWLPPEFDWVIGCSYTGQPTRVHSVRNLIGCNMSFRRAVLRETGNRAVGARRVRTEDGKAEEKSNAVAALAKTTTRPADASGHDAAPPVQLPVSLNRVDGFDSALGRVGSTPVGCEETELCIRIRRRHPDGVILYEPRARVLHHVSAPRATWRYFLRRCFSEGRSKAVVARLVGREAALSTEREYTRRVLPDGVRRGFRDIRHGDLSGLWRSSAIAAGLLVTASGYATARARGATRAVSAPTPTDRRKPAPVRVLAVELSEGVPALPDGGGPGIDRYGSAQVLVRLHDQPLGVLDIELPVGGLTAQAHATTIAERLSDAIGEHLLSDGLPPVDRRDPRASEAAPSCRSGNPATGIAPLVSVVVPTCGRVPELGRALDSIAALDYPNFEVLVVDNAPDRHATARFIEQRAAQDRRLRYTSEPHAGATHARNRGLAEVNGQIVAFTDDDVTVDRHWLRALVNGFTDENVAAVTGQVLARELDTPAQVWIEEYGGFGKGGTRRKFDRDGIETIEDGQVCRVTAAPGSLYPYLPGAYGTGANMAFRTAALRELGGFDPRLRTGEDIDVLMHMVLAGHALVYEPAAIVWHAHKREITALRRTMFHYGVGLSGVMVKCLTRDADGRRALLRRLPTGIAYALHPHSEKNGKKKSGYPATLTALELCGMALGPAYYAAAAWSARAGRKHL